MRVAKTTKKIFTMSNELHDRIFRRPGGFTLVEIMVVVVVIGMIAGLGSRMYIGRYKSRLVEKAAKDLVLTGRYARMVAIERGRRCTLVLQKDARRFYLTVGELDEEAGTVTEVIIYDSYSKPVELTGDVNFVDIVVRHGQTGGEQWVDDESEAAKEQRIVFYPSGMADAAVVKLGNGKRNYTYIVSAGTGKVRLESGLLEEIPQEVVDLDLDE